MNWCLKIEAVMLFKSSLYLVYSHWLNPKTCWWYCPRVPLSALKIHLALHRWLRLFLATTLTNISLIYAQTLSTRHMPQKKKKKAKQDNNSSGKEIRNDSLFSSFYTFTVADGWWKYLPQLWGVIKPQSKGGPGYISDTPFFALSLISWQCSGSIHRRKKKLAVLMHAAIPSKLSWDCFIICFPPCFSPYTQQS